DGFAVTPSRSHHILTSIPTVIYVLAVTAEGFPSEWVSDSVKRILGYNVEEALAPDWWINCLHPGDRDTAIEKTSILMSRGHLVQEYRFRSKEGHYLWMQDEASLLRDADGRPKEIIGFWTNISELKQAEEQAARARELEVEIGFKIQQTLLLDQPPRDFPGARVAALTIPSQRISGDFYDFFRHVDQCLDVIIGDVMGKGIPAALLGAASKSTFLQALSEIISMSERGTLPKPEEVVTLAHAKIARQLINLESFVTVSYARFDLERRKVELVDCGHMPVIHYRHRTGTCTTLHGSHVPLGISEREIYEQISEPFEPEDVFVFYSDGITEAQNSAGEFFGLSRLAECVRLNSRLDAWQLITKIRMSVVAFSNSETFADDLTCVVVKIEERKLPLARQQIEVRGDLQELAHARSFVRGFCASIPGGALQEKSTEELDLAVNEAMSNIIRHAYRDRTDQKILLGAEAFADRVIFRLHHLGEPFDPAAVPAPDFSGARENGFGVYMIAKLVDEVRYLRDERGRNCICLAKMRKAN
ncbi:MAG: SpoIIE family protein phosphatase, partial [Beijerinckiaceae bacterium]|nr:SpoIIE family protein phosphatase [Beijerinckiaceae bacterium]